MHFLDTLKNFVPFIKTYFEFKIINYLILGIGYLVKKGKNKIEWIKEDSIENNFTEGENEEHLEEIEEIGNLKKEIKELKYEDEKLDKLIDKIKTSFENLNEDKNFKEYGYVTFEDIKSLTKNQNNNVNLIAIKAPSGTSVEIPDPEHIEKIYLQTYEVKYFLKLKNMQQGKEEYNADLLDSLSKKHQIFLDSQNGEIMCYLVLNKSEEENLQRNELDVKNNINTFNPRSSFNNFILDQNFGSNSIYGKNSQVLQTNNSLKNIQNYYSESGMIM